MTFGKVIGGGLPGRRLRRARRHHGATSPRSGRCIRRARCPGTRSPPRPGLATLRACDEEVYRHLDATADRVGRSGIRRAAARRRSAPAAARGNLFSIFFAEHQVTNYDQARGQSVAAYAAFFHGMLDAGVYLPPSAFEAWFVSAAHDDEALERIGAALPGAAQAAAAALG